MIIKYMQILQILLKSISKNSSSTFKNSQELSQQCIGPFVDIGIGTSALELELELEPILQTSLLPPKSCDTLISWSRDKFKTLYLHFHKVCGLLT